MAPALYSVIHVTNCFVCIVCTQGRQKSILALAGSSSGIFIITPLNSSQHEEPLISLWFHGWWSTKVWVILPLLSVHPHTIHTHQILTITQKLQQILTDPTDGKDCNPVTKQFNEHSFYIIWVHNRSQPDAFQHLTSLRKPAYYLPKQFIVQTKKQCTSDNILGYISFPRIYRTIRSWELVLLSLHELFKQKVQCYSTADFNFAYKVIKKETISC